VDRKRWLKHPGGLLRRASWMLFDECSTHTAEAATRIGAELKTLLTIQKTLLTK
jgi:hypothetical protein